MRAVVVLGLLVSALSFGADKESVAAGRQRFRESCAACHGANAQGGRGPSLAKNADLTRITDQQLSGIIQHGIPGTSMPPFPMSDDKASQVVAYIRSLSSPAFRAFVDGDAAHGREIFGAHCETCHAIRGHGGLLGPDLSDVGAHMTVAELHDSITNPTPSGSVTVYMKAGSTYTGVVKDDSTYSMQLMAYDGHLHLIDKSQVATVDRKQKNLHDAAERGLDANALQDLVAFLSQQVVRPNLDGEARHLGDIH